MNTKTLSTGLLTSLTLLSVLFISACSSFNQAPVAKARSYTAEEIPVVDPDIVQPSDVEVDMDDFLKYWEIGPGDLEAVRQAAQELSQSYNFDEEEFLKYWEIGPGDLEAVRQAAQELSQSYNFDEEDFLKYWEIGPGDLEAARKAAETLSNG